MKKIFLPILMILMLVTTSKAVTLTIIQPEGSVTMTRPAERVITLSDLTNRIRWWKVISGGVDIINNQFVMPNNNVEIEPQYTGNQIVVIQGENGTISPGTTITTEGGNYTFLVNPNENYEIDEVIVDNESKGAIDSYEFTNVNENHVITAKFKPATSSKYTITTVTRKKTEVTGIYENHKCTVCGGYDHECELVNIYIIKGNSTITEIK